MMFLRKVVIGGGLIAALSLSGLASAGSFDSANVSASQPLSAFESVYIAPVNLALDHKVKRLDRYGDGDRPVAEKDAAAKAGDLYNELARAFSRTHSIASAPGAGVLSVTATITHLESSRPTRADYDREVSISASSRYAGGGAVTIVLSESGATLGEVSDSYSATLTDGRARGGIWDDADRAFSTWAKNLVGFVQSH